MTSWNASSALPLPATFDVDRCEPLWCRETACLCSASAWSRLQPPMVNANADKRTVQQPRHAKIFIHFLFIQSNFLEFYHHHNNTTILRPFFRDHPGEPVPEENFWTLWCKGRLTEADTPTIRLGATPFKLTTAHLQHPHHIFYGPDALPATQPTVSKHWRQLWSSIRLG